MGLFSLLLPALELLFPEASPSGLEEKCLTQPVVTKENRSAPIPEAVKEPKCSLPRQVQQEAS